VASYESQLRQAQRQQEFEAVANLDQQLLTMCSVHKQDFPSVRRHEAATPEAEVQVTFPPRSSAGDCLRTL
jgi:hypothetical protein